MTMRTESARLTQATDDSLPRSLEAVGGRVLPYGLGLVLFWVGALKFTSYEAEGVDRFASNSPLLSWADQLLGMRGFSSLVGIIEISLATLIATRPVLPKLSAVGYLGAIVMFVITLSFLLTTPGVWQPGYGFPALSPAPGQFLAKDLVLLGTAIWTAGEALRASDPTRRAISSE